MEKSIKRRLCVLVVLGMFAAIMMSPTVVAPPDGEQLVTSDGNYRIDIDNNADEGDRAFIVSHDAGTELFRIQETGEVGIGTTGPDAKLDILDTSGAQLRLTHTDGSKYADFQVDTNHDLTIRPSSTGQIKLQPTTDSTDFFQVWNGAQTIPVLNVDTVNYRVGIGTATGPQNTLDVEGGAVIGATYSGFNTAPINGLLVEGNVGIGVTSPNEQLEVNGKIRTNNVFNVAGTDGITQVIVITDGVGTHTLTFTGGILTGYTLV